MAIRQNMNLPMELNTRLPQFAATEGPLASRTSPVSAAHELAARPMLSPIASAANQPLKGMNPGVMEALKMAAVAHPAAFPTIRPFIEMAKTTTQIAQAALNQLSGSNQAVLQRAINSLKSRNLVARGLMNFLERKVKIGEVLAKVAKDWQADTQQDFADAFQMPKDDAEVMDAIVSIAILNDPELEGELMEENTAEPTQNDLLDNRRIVWQYPPPGTVLQPPYVVLLAVEHHDTRRAQETIQSILGGLVDHQGYKLPSAAAKKLAG